jgi:hypothetical protein
MPHICRRSRASRPPQHSSFLGSTPHPIRSLCTLRTRRRRRLRNTRFPAARYHLTGAGLSPAGSRQLRVTHRNESSNPLPSSGESNEVRCATTAPGQPASVMQLRIEPASRSAGKLCATNATEMEQRAELFSESGGSLVISRCIYWLTLNTLCPTARKLDLTNCPNSSLYRRGIKRGDKSHQRWQRRGSPYASISARTGDQPR